MTTKISVIITTYEPYHKYLSDCVDSIMFSDPNNVEIIIVNDSVIPVANAINRKEDEPVWGTGKARNIGANISTGECILFLDGDDTLFPQALQNLWDMYQCIKQSCGQKHIIHGNLLRGDNNKIHYISNQYRGTDIKQSPLQKPNRPYLCLIPREYHFAIGGFDESVETWEDLIYEMDMWIKGIPETHIDSVTYFYRWNEAGRRAKANIGHIHQTVKQFIYNRYKDYYDKNIINNPFKELIMCGCNKGKGTTTNKGFGITGKTATLPQITDQQEYYLEYTGTYVSRTVRGGATNIMYRFGTGSLKRKLIVDKNPEHINVVTEVHIDDARLLIQQIQKTGALYTVRVEPKGKSVSSIQANEPEYIPQTYAEYLEDMRLQQQTVQQEAVQQEAVQQEAVQSVPETSAPPRPKRTKKE